MEPIKNPEIKYTQIFINNEWVNSESGKKFPVINPATEKTIVDIAEGDKADVNKAVKAARAAFQRGSAWRTMDASNRGRLLYKLADLVERDFAILASLTSLEMGKTYFSSSIEIDFAIKCLRYFAGVADKIQGSTIPADGPVFAFTRLEPIGVCGMVVPWNFPVQMVTMKIAPALAAGNTVVLKPAEQSPLGALHYASLIKEAGFPAGVVNIIPGYGPTAGAAISEHMDVDKVSFTGSTDVGKLIHAASARSNLKKVTLELGGKSPLIILEDADLDQAADIANMGLFFNQGEVCCASSRTFVQDTVYDKFVEKAKQRAINFPVGDPFSKTSQMGPLVDKDQFEKVLSMIEEGKRQGAKLECGGSRHGDTGYYVQPTVFSNVGDDMKIAKEEIFGPVQQIIKFNDVEEAIKRANNTTYGLAAGIITKDINKALTYVQGVEAGTVWVNCANYFSTQTPFGGYKMSGFGRENGLDAIKEYTHVKCVYVKIPEKQS